MGCRQRPCGEGPHLQGRTAAQEAAPRASLAQASSQCWAISRSKSLPSLQKPSDLHPLPTRGKTQHWKKPPRTLVALAGRRHRPSPVTSWTTPLSTSLKSCWNSWADSGEPSRERTFCRGIWSAGAGTARPQPPTGCECWPRRVQRQGDHGGSYLHDGLLVGTAQLGFLKHLQEVLGHDPDAAGRRARPVSSQRALGSPLLPMLGPRSPATLGSAETEEHLLTGPPSGASQPPSPKIPGTHSSPSEGQTDTSATKQQVRTFPGMPSSSLPTSTTSRVDAWPSRSRGGREDSRARRAGLGVLRTPGESRAQGQAGAYWETSRGCPGPSQGSTPFSWEKRPWPLVPGAWPTPSWSTGLRRQRGSPAASGTGRSAGTSARRTL